MTRLERLQTAMQGAGLDALLLGGEGAGQFAAGHTRIGVHMGGSPTPATVVPRTGPPHVVTADPDGATGLPGDHVHGMMWDPTSLVAELPRWLGAPAVAPAALRIGVDALSPGGRALIAAAIPGCVLVDATQLLAEVMLPKSPGEIEVMEGLHRVVSAAARAGLAGDRAAIYRALEGSFPITYPTLGEGRAQVAARRGGLIAECRIGPGDPSVGEEALTHLAPGRTAAEVAADLPPAVEVVGLGRSYEAPLIRSGRAFPEDLTLVPGAVLALRWEGRGLTAVVEAGGARQFATGSGEDAR